jgi:NADH:ubiquinone oxidoreductase subunit 6 (subunit J)
MKIRMGWKARASLIFLIFAMLYLLAAPEDLLPFTFLDNLVIVVVAGAIWVIAVIVESTEEKPREEVRKDE